MNYFDTVGKIRLHSEPVYRKPIYMQGLNWNIRAVSYISKKRTPFTQKDT